MNMTTSKRSSQEIREFMSQQKVMTVPEMNLSSGMKGALVGALNKHLGGDENRRLVIGWLFIPDGLIPLSTHQLKNEQWSKLSDWVGLWKDEDDNEWKVRSTFPFEAAQVLTEVIKEYSALSNESRAKLPKISDNLQTVVALGGTITHVNDTSVLETPKFDERIKQTSFGNLVLSGNKDRDSF